ncbi:MAG: DegQ family serine endoprotease [Roseibium sp.]
MRRASFQAFVLAVVSVLAVSGSPVLSAEIPTLDQERGVMTMAPLLEKTTPAVVNVSVVSRMPIDDNPLLRDPFFRRFFDLPETPEQRPERQAMSAGSGVIVDAEKGYVLTNHHVVDNADKITVTLKDRRRYEAKLIGSDPATDIALVQIEVGGLSELPMGDSDTLKVGDLVVAVGNPFGLGQTVTSGIVSALGRSGIGTEKYEDFIQTDAPINPGNSGGALINTKGELIGINTAIIAPGGGNVGIGFAVPSNMAKAVMEQLLRHGEVRRGRIGVTIQDLTPELAEALDLPVSRGAVVAQVEAGSPAEEAGLLAGDVIVEVDGDRIDNSADLRNKVGLVERGREIGVAYLRDGKKRTVRIRVGEARQMEVAGGEAVAALAGARFTEIPEDHPAYGETEGVLVAEVTAGSAAWLLGLRPGDIVLAVNRTRVASIEELQAATKSAGKVIALNVLRGNTQIFLVAR